MLYLFVHCSHREQNRIFTICLKLVGVMLWVAHRIWVYKYWQRFAQSAGPDKASAELWYVVCFFVFVIFNDNTSYDRYDCYDYLTIVSDFFKSSFTNRFTNRWFVMYDCFYAGKSDIYELRLLRFSQIVTIVTYESIFVIRFVNRNRNNRNNRKLCFLWES